MTALSSTRPVTALMQVSQVEPEDHGTVYHPRICALVLVAADCVSIVAATIVASWCTAPFQSEVQSPSSLAGLPLRADLVILFAGIGLYLATKGRYLERIPFWTETRLVVSITLCAASAEVILGILTNNIQASIHAIVALLTFAVLAPFVNRLAKQGLSSAGIWTLPIVVVSDELGVVEAALQSDRSLGYRILYQIDPGTLFATPAGERLQPILSRCGARRVLIAISNGRQRDVVACALRERVPFTLVQPFAFQVFASEPMAFFGNDALLLLHRNGLSRPVARALKIVFDVSAAFLLLLVISPLFLVLMLIIRQDGGPTLFAQRRIGAKGRPFYCLKFRTMVVDSEQVLKEVIARDPTLAAEWAATRKLTDDPRITRVGRFLRRTSLDELPQLINVLRLEMSLVGPRPIVENEIPLYGEDISHYYATRPGLTGLWQVSGRSDISYARRVQLDAWYVNNWAIWYDFVIVLKTIPAVLGCRGAR